jgi:hypothetical protein
MINALTGLGYGIIGFAVLIGIGIVILGSLGTAVAGCATGFSYQTNGTKLYTTGLCCNNTADVCIAGHTNESANPSTATQNLNTINNTYLGTNLVSWIPVIIVLVIGMLFLGAFLTKKGKKY